MSNFFEKLMAIGLDIRTHDGKLMKTRNCRENTGVAPEVALANMLLKELGVGLTVRQIQNPEKGIIIRGLPAA